MDKCRLCGEIIIYFTSSKENSLNSEIQIIAERLLQFEGYASNKNELIFICDDCRDKLESFIKFLKIIKKGQEKWQPVEQEQQIKVVEEEFNDIQHNEIIDKKRLNTKLTKSKNKNGCYDIYAIEPSNEPPKKRLRRPPKRYQDNEVLMTKKPIQIISNTKQSTCTTSMALLPKIAGIRLSNGRIIGHLIQSDNYEKYSKFRIICRFCSSVFCFEKEYRKHLEDHKDKIQNNLETITQSNDCVNEEKSTISFESFLYYCEICEKSFPEHFAVRRHYKQAHSQERKFLCFHCNAKFKYKFNLDYHMAKHIDKKKFECSYCKKKFVLRYELIIHQRIHNNVKPYKCQICSISFAHRSNLVKHCKLLHTQKKAFKCSMCRAYFTSLAYLKRHEKNHSQCQENLLQTTDISCDTKSLEFQRKTNYDKQDFEKYVSFSNINSENNNTSYNNLLTVFDSLQSNLKFATLNSNNVNNSCNFEYNSNNAGEEFNLSNQLYKEDNTCTNVWQQCADFKMPTTNEIILYNDGMIKSPLETGSFQEGNTTIKIFSNKKIDTQQNIEKNITTTTTSSSNNNISVFSNLKNSTNSSNFININSMDMKNSTHSSYTQINENSIISIENKINCTNSTQNLNSTISLVNSPKKSPLTKTLQNEETFEETSHSTTNNIFYNLNSLNMTNLNNSTKSIKLQNEENFKFSIENSKNTSPLLNLQNFNNSTNSPKKSPLLEFNENLQFSNNNGQETDNNQRNQFDNSLIDFSKTHTKPFKLVKLSEDYLKTKNVISYNSNNVQQNSPFIKIINFTDSNKNSTEIDFNSSKKMPTFKLYANSNTTLKNSSTHDPITIVSHKDGIIKSESCLISPPIQISKADILNTNIATESHDEIVNIITDQCPTSSKKLPAIKVLKCVKLLKTLSDHEKNQNSPIKNDKNIPTHANEFLNNQIFFQNLPSTWENSVNTLTKKKNTNCAELLKIETYTNSPPIVEHTTNSLLMKCPVTEAHMSPSTNNIPMENSLTKSLPFGISKTFTVVEMKSKPVKIYNLNNVKNLFTNSSLKNIPIKLITKSTKPHDINNLNSSTIATSLVKVPNKFAPHLSIRKTPLKLKFSPKHSLLKKTHAKPLQNSDSLLMPKIGINKVHNETTSISSNSSMITKDSIQQLLPCKPLITNVEILNPLTVTLPLNGALNAAPTFTTQNLVKIPIEYKFQCNKCGKYFKHKCTLNKHLRTHTGEKPYKCHLCPKSYGDPSNYKKHKILHKNAANALNLSPHLPSHHAVHNSPSHSIASDPDPDGIEIMQTIKKFECSSTTDNDDVESLTSSTMESYMWEEALDHAIMNDQMRENVKRNLADLSNVVMPLNRDQVNVLNLTTEDPD